MSAAKIPSATESRSHTARKIGDTIRDGDCGKMANGDLLICGKGMVGMRVQKANDIYFRNPAESRTQHTPTPWLAYDTGAVGKGNIGTIVFSTDLVGSSEAERKANAALIVRAVNCHEDLLEALRFAESFAYAVAHKLPTPDGNAQLNLIRAAIAKSEGRA